VDTTAGDKLRPARQPSSGNREGRFATHVKDELKSPHGEGGGCNPGKHGYKGTRTTAGARGGWTTTLLRPVMLDGRQ
jgi:hypothetical protein